MQQHVTLAGGSAYNHPASALPLPAWILHDGRRRPCFVVDLSVDGARIHCAEPPPPGARIDLELEGRSMTGAEVVWCEGERVGLRFPRGTSLGPGGRPGSGSEAGG
jgi:hypothetical protein